MWGGGIINTPSATINYEETGCYLRKCLDIFGKDSSNRYMI